MLVIARCDRAFDALNILCTRPRAKLALRLPAYSLSFALRELAPYGAFPAKATLTMYAPFEGRLNAAPYAASGCPSESRSSTFLTATTRFERLL